VLAGGVAAWDAFGCGAVAAALVSGAPAVLAGGLPGAVPPVAGGDVSGCTSGMLLALPLPVPGGVEAGARAVVPVFTSSEFALSAGAVADATGWLPGAVGAGSSTGALTTGLPEALAAGAAGGDSLTAGALAAGVAAGATAVTGGVAARFGAGFVAAELAAGGGVRSTTTLGVTAGAVELSMSSAGLFGLRSTSIAGVADRMRPSSPR
jgi:hypothetical protein